MNIRFLRAGLGGLVAVSALVLGLALVTNTASAADRHTTNPQVETNWGSGCVYWVRPGDTLFSIAVRYGVSPYYLAQVNGLYNPNFIYAGMQLWVPCGNVPPPMPPYPQPPHPQPMPPCNQSTKYQVQPGDNLFRIALNHGTTVDAIRDANNLWGRVLRPGSILIIPCPGSVNYGTGTPMPPADSVPPAVQETPVPPLQLQTPQVEPPATQGPQPQQTPQIQPPVTPILPPNGPTLVPPGQTPGGSATLAPEPAANITLSADAVTPNAATVKAGQSVVWINSSQTSYTVLSGFPGQPNGLFNSAVIPPGGTWVYTFTTIGSYSFYVMEKTTLTGQINVTP